MVKKYAEIDIALGGTCRCMLVYRAKAISLRSWNTPETYTATLLAVLHVESFEAPSATNIDAYLRGDSWNDFADFFDFVFSISLCRGERGITV